MSPIQSIKVCLDKYLDFDGRASRPEYWWFFAAALVLSLLFSWVSDGLYYLFQLLVIVPGFSAGARRLHDTNRSGWWQLIAFVPFGIFVLLVLLALPGVDEGNRYDQEGGTTAA